MKQQNRRCQELQFMDPDFADGLYGGESKGRSSDRQSQRKSQQYCRQVQRSLNLALAGLYVEEVTPAPDCGHLLVFVAVPEGRSVADVLGELRKDAPRLRTEVAMSISRKRAPELFFAPAFSEGGTDE